MSTKENLTPITFSKEEAQNCSPLELAYIGDTVYDMLVRVDCLRHGGTVATLHKRAVSMVNASAQARALKQILTHLTPQEEEMYKRGRNAHPKHKSPKAATTAEYACATGFETLLGYLYLQGNFSRVNELFSLAHQKTTI